MTTQVKVEIVQEHMPIVVEVLREDGSIGYTCDVQSAGKPILEYVHSGQVLRVREMTTAEIHANRVSLNAARAKEEPNG